MNRNEKFVVTINRQFGSGGHEIGMELSNRLGVKLLDKQILTALARKFKMNDEGLQALEARNPSWWDDFTQFYRNNVNRNDYRRAEHDVDSHEMFRAQAEVIRQVADEESCVIIGRGAFDIFKHHPNVLKIFVHSTMESRIKRVVDKYGVTPDDAKVMIVDNDYSRELYTKTFTGTEWYDARNYDLCLDVTRFGVNGAVDVIMGVVGA